MSEKIEQPYAYLRHELVEPDWTRLPGWRHITAADWARVQWRRVNCIKNIKGLRALMGDLLTDAFYADPERDQAERATMSMLVTPQMMNTMVPCVTESGALPRAGEDFTRAFYADPVRRYMLPVFSDRRRLAEPPILHPRLVARTRHVGRRGPDPPLSHQGPGRAAVDLPSVLRPLHPDGPRRQLHAGHPQAQVRPQAGRPLRRDDGLPARDSLGARRGRLGRISRMLSI